jgi:hypothetical protein
MEQREPANEMDAIVTGATTGSQPAQADEVRPNRSGSGGSGGPASDEQPSESEGSTGRSLEELTNADDGR